MIFLSNARIVVISAKWIVAGRRRSSAVVVGSFDYLRWWVIERLFDQWELWCGEFIKDTVLINAFYRACGSNVSLVGARIDTFLRDLDLMTVGYGASIEGNVYARSFFREGQILGMRFARVSIYGTVEKFAVVQLGAEIEEGAVLKHMSVAAPFSRAEGGKAMHEHQSRLSRRCWIEVAKLALLLPLLYAPFVTTSTIVAWTMRRVGWFALTFRYRPLVWWVLSYYSGLIVLVLFVVVCKWLLIGFARPGSPRSMMMVRAWFVDYVWQRIVVRLCGIMFQGNGLAVNLLLRALGVDMAWSARFVSAEAVSASEADMITVEARAQISLCTVSCVTAASSYAPVRIGCDAEVGFNAYIEAGTEIGEGSVVAQQTVASGVLPPGSVTLGKATFQQPGGPQKRKIIDPEGVVNRVAIIFAPFVSRALLLALLGFVALIPSYELAVLVLFGSANFYEDDEYQVGIRNDGSRWKPPVDRNIGILCIGPITLVAFASMSLVYRLWLFLIFGNFRNLEGTSRWVFETFHEYQFMIIYASQKYVMPLVRGSRLAVAYMRFWGADVDASAFVNYEIFYEAPLISLEAGCVVDEGLYGRAA
ncbi:hypothetical protein CTAYLR_003149 [Chrysophaeum taylorii]|uniref:Uncharacterized protein n=1 Tax=Chrysophaeum taylorii TaxID=2483200 RepID=A0AAD7UNF8_9STRA|nr:hypothetical protein CTAYLR_003149 [Chrysophaeum taylorii]